MMRIFVACLSLFLAACQTSVKTAVVSEPDALSYQEYLTDLTALKEGKRSMDARFGFNKDIGLIYSDFKELATRVAIVSDRRLNQQYVFIYSEYSELNEGLSAGADAENVIGLRNAKVSGFYMDLYIQIKDSVLDRVQPSYGKIIIVGFGTGAGLANILALDLNFNKKIPSQKLEVITFAGEAFSRGFSPTFNSTNIVLEGDSIAMEGKKCCNFAKSTLLLHSEESIEMKHRILAYKRALNKFIAQ